MFRTFNMGVGMVLAVSPENVDFVLANSDGYIIGEIQIGSGEVELV
jgi:phosphoribosylformylglycinamidine cyclo-ligase